ncbi:hypothetical protein [Gracilibacillus kekensis]|uniref:Hook-length control protein FliK n=1 Tax=Gracilibacillus kekensis TaxID=1027249 RepID=A0A1M7PG95_9BACI|nr:hypothetical protein [Gracilibacillus kekensis]SHN15995.1 hypothetical protein SAMN05216179_2161 [Gracilibacillus kekensis]
MVNMQSFSNALRVENTRLNNSQASLRAGQMLTGKVLELYPNQKASIQLGGSQIVAQLETALSSKQDYLFQVTSVGDLIRLKKISEAPIQNRLLSDQIMQQIGLPNNRALKAFMQQVMNQNIPFNFQEAQSIANLIEQFGGSSSNRELMQMMLQKGFPLSESVFKNLQSYQSSQLGQQISQLQQALQQPGQSQVSMANLQQQLAIFGANNRDAAMILRQFIQTNQQALQNTNQVSAQILQQMSSGNGLASTQLQDTAQQIHQVLQQQLPLSSNKMQTFQTFLNRFSQVVQQEGATDSLKHIFQQNPLFSKVMQVLSQQDKSQIQQWLQQPKSSVVQQQQTLSILQNVASQQLTQQNQNMLRTLLLHMNQVDNDTLSVRDEFLHVLKHFVNTSGIQDETRIANTLNSSNGSPANMVALMQSIKSVLPTAEQQTFQQWLQQTQPSAAQNQQITDMLHRMNVQQLPQVEQNVVRNLLTLLDTTDQPFNKEQIMQAIRQFFSQSDSSIQQLRDQDLSLKQNLIQANQQTIDFAGDRIQRLVQTITGMQINMVQDDQTLLQQNFQIPGERFGLAHDIRMQFEGKQKNETGEIDPDYCRILFHLDLNNLGETMMTLSIQKRVINITVYNDSQALKPLIDQFKPLLKQKLDGLDYQLSSVSNKLLSDSEASSAGTHSSRETYPTAPTEGIDFRV